jgi:hypothetical protein
MRCGYGLLHYKHYPVTVLLLMPWLLQLLFIIDEYNSLFSFTCNSYFLLIRFTQSDFFCNCYLCSSRRELNGNYVYFVVIVDMYKAEVSTLGRVGLSHTKLNIT